jgi:hypothetical protein
MSILSGKIRPMVLKEVNSYHLIVINNINNLYCNGVALNDNGVKIIGEISDYLISDFHIFTGKLTYEQEEIVKEQEKRYIKDLINQKG